MAVAIRYVCDGCGHAIRAWSDGNPYYIDELGVRQYAYHPNHELLAQCVGNDCPHLCLSCGHEFMVDSEAPITACPKCKVHKFVATYKLDGQPCPYCKAGAFTIDPDFHCIS